MKKITLLFFLSMLCPMLCHQSMAGESFGTTYPIQETDLLQDIQNQLKKKEKSGELKRLQEEAIARSKNSILNPQRVAGVIRTTNPRQYLYDPSIVVDQDYKTPDGQIFAQRGQRFNPLTIMPLETPFLFFDAADPEQLTVAKSYLAKHPQIKLVLVGGSWSDAQKSLGHKVYFDQAGKLTQKFGIHQVPAFVSQKDLFLQIQELKMGEKP
jgi:conjugal transfer pilus assembly protein TraW